MKIIGLILFGFLLSASAQAADAPADTSLAKKPTPAEKDSRAYQEFMQKMSKFDERVRSSEEAFQKLVLKKRAAHSAEEKHKIIDEMKTAYADYSTNVDELNKVKKELKYRFPSEGDATQRGYLNVKKKSIDELEKTVDLSTTLSTTKMMVDEKYKTFMPPKSATPNAEKAKKADPADPATQRIRLER